MAVPELANACTVLLHGTVRVGRVRCPVTGIPDEWSSLSLTRGKDVCMFESNVPRVSDRTEPGLQAIWFF